MATAAGTKQRTFLGHPLGLYVLFFTEMWERFSYYGMKALLFVYMVNYFRWTQKQSSYIMQIYTSLVYLTPILGGYLADRYLGNRKAVIIGALLMAIGHFLMAFDEYGIFMSALVFLILGNGFFKPNMSTQVGRLYPANDGRRDGAYTIFYMGINLGAFLSPLVCGWLADKTVGGYHSGFTMAGIGMMLGLICYVFGQPFIREVPADAPAVGSAESSDLPEANGQRGTRVEGELPGSAIQAGKPSPGLHGTELQAGEPAPGLHGTDGPSETPGINIPVNADRPLSEAEAERAPSTLGKFADFVPFLLYLLAAGLFAWGGYVAILSQTGMTDVLHLVSEADIFDAVAYAVGGGCLVLMGYLVSVVRGAMRDRILVILILAIFLVFFWGAFEQASIVHNIWADQFTNRFLTEEMQLPAKIAKVEKKIDEKPEKLGYWDRFKSLFPNMVTLKKNEDEDANLGWWDTIKKSFNPVPTAWYLSINAALIVLLAPLFAWMWTALDRRGLQPSIPLKMVFGVALMSASMVIMMGAAREENQKSEIAWNGPLPPGIVTTQQAHAGTLGKISVWENPEKDKLASSKGEKGDEPDEIFNAGRLTWDKEGKKLIIYGVLDKNVCDELIETTAPPEYQKKVKELQKASENISDTVKSVEVKLDRLPPGMQNMDDWKYAAIKDTIVKFDPQNKTLTAYQPLARKETKALYMAGSEPRFRETVLELFVQTSKLRVSMWWLFWSYVLATLGELCLSPVGLSMVSKLAPARFATMLMGFWLIISFFGNFAAGAMGGIWGTVAPINFFLITAIIVGVAALVLLVMARWVTIMMHGVK